MDHTLQVLQLWLIKSNSTHSNNDQQLSIVLDLRQENAVIVAYTCSECLIKIIKKFLDNKPALARRKPLVFFFMGVYFAGGLCDFLNTETEICVVVEQCYCLVDRFLQYFVIQVSEEHLAHSQHAAPP